MEFDNLYAKSELKLIVNNDIAGNMLNHAYLLCGQDDVLLNYFAKEFAKGILCQAHNNKPCENCKSCIEYVNSNNPDYYEIGLLDDENSIKSEK